MQVEVREISCEKLWPNTGQIAGLPQNPRLINDERFDKLVKSIIDHPEMLHLRECLVTPYLNDYVIIAGNMRHRAVSAVCSMSDDEFAAIIEEKQSLDNFNEWLSDISRLRENKEIPCKIIPKNVTIEQLKAYVIKDNIGYGSHDWDMLANEWDQQELIAWGMEIPGWDDEIEEEESAPASDIKKIVIEFMGTEDDMDELKDKINVVVEEFPNASVR